MMKSLTLIPAVLIAVFACLQTDVQGQEKTSSSGNGTVIEGYRQTGPANGKNTNCFFSFEQGKAISNKMIRKLTPGRDGRAIGKLVQSDDALKNKVRKYYDFFVDTQFGLICNTQFKGWEFGVGSGGVIDMGAKKLSEVKLAPQTGYVAGLKFDEESPVMRTFPLMKIGNTYVIKTGTGKYGKFQILDIDRKKGTLRIDWEFQPNGSRQFK